MVRTREKGRRNGSGREAVGRVQSNAFTTEKKRENAHTTNERAAGERKKHLISSTE